jgi:hypothetical protein
MATWASPVFDWSTRNYGDKDFNIDTALQASADRAATMNDPTNFRKRKVAMMNEYEIPHMQAEYGERRGLQNVANQPAMARLEWEKSPENQAQWLQRIWEQNKPSQLQAETQEKWRDYQSGEAAFERAKTLKSTAPPDWGVGFDESAGGMNWFNKHGPQSPGFLPGFDYEPRKFVGPPTPQGWEKPGQIVSDARTDLRAAKKMGRTYATPSLNTPMSDWVNRNRGSSWTNSGMEWLDRQIQDYYKR